jgi:multidrug resistance efflux pump
MYRRDSILFENKVLTKSEIETSNVNMLSKEQEFKMMNKDITTNKYQIEDVKSKIQQLNTQRVENENQLDIDLVNSYNELTENIRQWEHKYIFIAPLKGRIELLNFWKNDDYVETGKEVFAVIPAEKDMIGQLQLPEQGAGKVKLGQDVIIKLDNYPYTQYGSIRGKVKSMSMITNEQTVDGNQKVQNYLVTVSLPSGLKTNYGTKLDFHFESKGDAEIITSNERLIQRLFDNLKHETR